MDGRERLLERRRSMALGGVWSLLTAAFLHLGTYQRRRYLLRRRYALSPVSIFIEPEYKASGKAETGSAASDPFYRIFPYNTKLSIERSALLQHRNRFICFLLHCLSASYRLRGVLQYEICGFPVHNFGCRSFHGACYFCPYFCKILS